MKKLLLIISLFIIMIQISACTNNQLNMIYAKASEIQECYYYYEDIEYEISLISGKRESEYLLNGYNTPLKQYCVLMIEQQTSNNIEMIQIIINNKSYTAAPLLNPYNNNYVYDFEIEIGNVNQLELIININNNENTYILDNATKYFKYDIKKCLNTALFQRKNELLSFFKNKTFNGEVFIRIIKLKSFDLFVYQFLFIDTNQNTIQCLVNPLTNKVVT